MDLGKLALAKKGIAARKSLFAPLFPETPVIWTAKVKWSDLEKPYIGPLPIYTRK